MNHALVLDPSDYKREMKVQQERLNKLEMEMYQKRIPLLIMYEGWDAAGKGGNIKRVAQALDACLYRFPALLPRNPSCYILICGVIDAVAESRTRWYL